MAWLQSLDDAVFRFLNQELVNPVFDAVMPMFAGHALFWPAVIGLAATLMWKGGVKGRVFVVVLALTIALGDGLVINTVKKAVDRPRPGERLPDARRLVGRGGSGAMPSSHTATWFAATLVTFVYYRRSARVLLPLAVAQGFSRVYLGAHHPSDVLAGALLGAGYGAVGVWGFNWLWQALGPRWFPDWWRKLPSLLVFPPPPAPTAPASPPCSADAGGAYLRLGYLLIAVLFVARLWYLGSGRIELSEDEAYQWTWSKHLALSYYSKPPMIAVLQFIGTSLWGDRELGVRFLSPVIAAGLSLLLLRFMSRVAGARAAFWLVAVLTCTPLLAVGSTLITIDPPLVLFWTIAMLAGWRAVQPDGSTGHWLGVGLGMGLAFLSKYSAMFQIVCFALFFLFWKPARLHLRRPGPWLALGLFALGTLPVIIWNAQHGWVTVHHVGENAKIDKPWSFTLRYFFEFAGTQAGILNPVFFAGMLVAMAGAWRLRRRDSLLLYLLCMGAPVFLGYWAYTLHSRVLPNWIAPSVVPLFCLMVIWWDRRWSEGSKLVARWLATGIALGAVMVVVLHDTRLIGKVSGRYLPPKVDPHRRVHGWKETAALAEAARQELRKEGRETFIIASHYGLTGQISFYLPEARRSVATTPLVYYRSSDRPRNQFYFWPGYRQQRPGQNAIYVDEVKPPRLVRGWWKKWLRGQKDLYETDPPQGDPPPREILAEFESVTDLGVRDVVYRGRVLRRIQLFACRGLRGS